jgi:hypothetical protein
MLLTETTLALTGDERDYLQASITRQKNAERRRRYFVLTLVVF